MFLQLFSILWISIASNFGIFENIKLTGKVTETHYNIIKISYTDHTGKRLTDSCSVTKNRFHFALPIKDVTEIELTSISNNDRLLKSDKFIFWIEPVNTTLDIEGNDPLSLKINKEKTIIDESDIQARKSLLRKKISQDNTNLGKLSAKLKEATSTTQKRIISKEIAELEKRIIETKIKEAEFDIQYIKTNPSSFANINLFYERAYKRPEYPSIEALCNLFETMSIMVKKSPEGRLLKERLDIIANSQVGKKSSPISFEDFTDQKEIQTEFFLGKKMVLIDFWASWCIPCREDFPELKEIYKEYQPKGLEIISISTDTDTSAYHQAIKKDGIDIWKNGLITEKIRAVFNIPALPIKYLIDKDGYIIGKWRGGGKENLNDFKKLLSSTLTK
jgi:thiol-disulfide isomerase/thioredoxin